MFENIMMEQNQENDFLPFFSLDEDSEPTKNEPLPTVLPILPLKNTVLFPGVVIPITVSRTKSINAIQRAYEDDKVIAVLSQQDTKVENPTVTDLYQVGTAAKILRLLRMPDGTTTAILQGRSRFVLKEMMSEDPYMLGNVQYLDYEAVENTLELEAMVSSIKDLAKQIIELSPNIPNEANVMVRNIRSEAFLLSFIASNLGIKNAIKQQILETNDLLVKARLILTQMDAELQLLELKERIENKVRGDIEKQQRNYFLNQQLKTIQEELGNNPQEEEIKRLIAKAELKQWKGEITKIFQKELDKFKRINANAPEYAIQLNYLDLITDLPWSTEVSKDNFDIKKIKAILDKDHFGLEKVKERILEHLSVLKLKGDLKSPILCLVGPPGVGKTSLGASIAKALKRKYVRMALGGLHDESEIRGHRKTYIGAMPGRILQNLKKAGTANPVFILDEIDKLGNSFRGDPSSALLEVLDPEQNSTFYDNYLEAEYDLSKILFIATANYLSGIQPALLDRMEVIDISGYSIEEKAEIAMRHLISQQREAHGLKAKHVDIPLATIELLIQEYTRESGVRSLNRVIASIMRYVAKKVATNEVYDHNIKPEDLKDILGSKFYSNDYYEDEKTAGVAIGLAWTRVGGDILFLETNLSRGSGRLTLTGNLGEVMKESAITAISFLKSNAESIGMPEDIFDKNDIHIHVPEGGIPKDGPSAGITMMTTVASAFLNKPVKPFLAMTGEITLRGKVLPVGGIKEKILAAKRAGIKEIILCNENAQDVEEIPQEYISGLKFHYVSRMLEVLEIALSEDDLSKGALSEVALSKEEDLSKVEDLSKEEDLSKVDLNEVDLSKDTE